MEEKKPFLTKKELITVLIITALLVAILVPLIINVSEEVILLQHSEEMRIAMTHYMDDHKTYPPGTTGYYFETGIADGEVYRRVYAYRDFSIPEKVTVTSVNQEAKTFVVDGVTYIYDVTDNPKILIVLPQE